MMFQVPLFTGLWVISVVFAGDIPGAPTAEIEADGSEQALEEMAEPTSEEESEETPPVKPPLPGLVTPDGPHWDLEMLYHQQRFEEGLVQAEPRMLADPADVYANIHMFRFLFETGEQVDRTDTSMDKEAHYVRMRDISNVGLEHHPDHPHLLFARGIAMGRLGTTRGVLASLFMARGIEKDWLGTAQSDYVYSSIGGEEQLPCDAFTTLGIFYRLLPDWWIIKVITGTRGDLSKSVEWLEKADSCAPNRIRTLKELGVSQVCLGQKTEDPSMVERGLATIREYMGISPVIKTDFIDVRHGKMLLAHPEYACEYSRDGQQDLDEDKLETP